MDPKHSKPLSLRTQTVGGATPALGLKPKTGGNRSPRSLPLALPFPSLPPTPPPLSLPVPQEHACKQSGSTSTSAAGAARRCQPPAAGDGGGVPPASSPLPTTQALPPTPEGVAGTCLSDWHAQADLRKVHRDTGTPGGNILKRS